MKLLIDSVNNKVYLNDIDITDSVKEVKIETKNLKETYLVLQIPTENIDMK